MVLLRVKWKGYEDPSDITWEPEKVLKYVDYISVPWRLERLTDVFFYIEMISQRSSMNISKNKVAERKF